MDSFKTYKIASAIEKGISHQRDNIPCQDAIKILKKDNFIFLGMADGAGSKRYAYDAAWLIVEVLALEFEKKLYKYLKSENIEYQITSFIENILAVYSAARNIDYKELSSTLLFAVLFDDKYIIGHIGDGIIVNISEDLKLDIFSEPENFEFANETVFCNTNSHKNRLRIYQGDVKEIENGLLLCTDGVEDAIYDYTNNKIVEICYTMINWLDNYSSKKASKGLSHNLKENISKKSQDDLSIIILKRIKNATV